MADETATADTATAEAPDEVDEEAPQTDELHQGLLDRLTDTLGDAIVGSHIAPGHALWVRVTREAWVDAAEAAKARLGCTFFDFLSAIDWMPSPWGRYEDAAGVDSTIPEPDPTAAVETGYAEAQRILTAHRAELETLAKGLLEYETLTGDEIKDLLAGRPPVREGVTEPAAPRTSAVPTAGKPRPRPEPGTDVAPQPQA